MDRFYRFVVDNIGIFEAVDRDCPKDSPMREGKPSGAWLYKAGNDYPGAVSYFKKDGLESYIFSDLLEWHSKVVDGTVSVIISTNPKNILFEDDKQIILNDFDIEIEEIVSYKDFLKDDNLLPEDLRLF